jgi:hypothetical protein
MGRGVVVVVARVVVVVARVVVVVARVVVKSGSAEKNPPD